MSVVMRNVSGSMARTPVTVRSPAVYGFGLLGMVRTRSNEKITSSAVNGLPSLNLTPGRSLNSHSLSLIAVQEMASRGSGVSSALVATSGSNRWRAMAIFGAR